MKIGNSYKLILTIIIVVTSIQSFAQQPGSTHNEQVTIVSSYDPSINKAFKINTAPGEMLFNLDKPEFKYEALDITLPTNITMSPIKPVVINADKRTKTYNNLLMAGVGSLFSPYIDFFHSSGSKNDYRFDANIYQLSTFKNIKDYSPSPEVRAMADIDYRKYFKYHIMDAGFKYNMHSVRYYGFKPDDFPNANISDSRLKQTFNTASLNLGIRSNYSSGKKLNHSIDVEGYYLFDSHKTRETFASLNLDLHKSFEVTDMLDYQNLGVEAKALYYGNTDSLATSTDILVSATPYFTGKYGLINFNIGLNFNYLNTNNSKFYFYPILDANLSLIPEYLTVFAGVDGEVKKNSYKMLSDINPWISSTTSLGWDRYFRAYGGIRGNFGQKVNYSAQLSWKKFNNMFFFINTQDGASAALPYNKFSAVYDGGSVFGVEGQITFSASDKVNLIAGAKYNAYSLDSLSNAYHKPISEFKLGIDVALTDKIKAWADIYYYGKRVALDPTIIPLGTTIDLDGFIDMNAGVEYKLTSNFSVWLNVNNILNNDYQRYLNYPVHGIQIMGGLTYRF